MTIRGAPADVVARALEAGDPLPGTAGFAGKLPDGRLVRDVLGRYPLFVDGDDWSHRPHDVDDPTPVPAGHVVDGAATTAWRLPDPEPVDDRRTAVGRLRRALSATLDDLDDEGLAVAFSGGVDSAVVASQVDAPLFVAGFPGGRDVENARDAARRMGRRLRVVEIDRSDLEAAVPVVSRAIDRTNAMDVSIAVPLYLVARRAREAGYERLALGQGADELFGGYAKVARAPVDPRVEATTVRGATRELLGTLAAQFTRDVLAVRAAGLEPVTPLVHDRIVEVALALPDGLLVGDGERKYAFRLAAREFVPDPVAFREKTAVQYGSYVARELDRLARDAGFKRRMDDHVTWYVRDRCR